MKDPPPFIKIVDTAVCQNKEHLNEYYNNIIKKGGEGLVLKESHSLYKKGRSSSFRKLKPYFDTEVLVVRNNYPQGFDCEQ